MKNNQEFSGGGGILGNKIAFTLIELLVVVLIIGILAAIAVPQYQKAVLRSRAAEALTNLKALANAQAVYMLANTDPTFKFGDLDVNMNSSCTGNPCTAGRWTYYINGSTLVIHAYYGSSIDDTTLTISYRFQKNTTTPDWEVGEFACLPRGNSQWIALCKSLAGPGAKTASFVNGTGYIWQ